MAFGAAYEDEVKFSEKQWQEKIKNVIFAIDNEKIVGLIAYDFESSFKMRHIAYINDLYVNNNYRQMGIGSNLLKRTIQEIQKKSRIEKIKLIVDPIQKGAFKLYKKFGFKKIALIKKELKYKGDYYDDLHMEMWLK